MPSPVVSRGRRLTIGDAIVFDDMRDLPALLTHRPLRATSAPRCCRQRQCGQGADDDGRQQRDGSGDFDVRYGPWALVAGASEGVGAAYAHALAARGLNVALLARRTEVLDDVASSIRSASGVETMTLAVDLAEPDAAAIVLEAMSGLDIGMFMYGAGADPNYELFLEQPVGDSLSLVRRNCMTPLALCHALAGPMVTRGRVASSLVSSGAGFAGARNMVAYGATKAFDTVMGEALWAELDDRASTCW